MVDGIVKKICLNNGDLCGQIEVQFENGQIKDGEESHLFNAIYKNKKSNTITVAAATEDILYHGNVTRTEELYNHFLVLRKRKGGKIRLVPYDSIKLSPKIYDNNIESNTKTSIMELNKQFGSRKIKKMTEQRERWQMDISAVQDDLEKTVAAVDLDETDLLQSKINENDNTYRPPIDRDAPTKDQVYKLEDVVSTHVLDALQEEAAFSLKANLDELDLLPSVKNQMVKLQESFNSNQEEKCKILLVVNYLSKYYITPARNINKKFVICESSPELNSYIIENFSLLSNTGRTRPISMKDKVVCYIMVLMMLASDYQIDVDALSRDLKISVKKLQEIGRVLAFSPGKGKNLMILKVPLPAVVKTPSKKRKR